MEKLGTFLARPGAAVAWLEGALPPDLAPRAAAQGLRVARVAAGHARHKPAFLQAAAAGLALPAHFGMNWDALEDALLDLSWLDDGGLLVVFEGAGALAQGAPRDLATLVEVVRAAVEFWSGERRKVLFLFQGAGRPAGVPRVTSEPP